MCSRCRGFPVELDRMRAVGHGFVGSGDQALNERIGPGGAAQIAQSLRVVARIKSDVTLEVWKVLFLFGNAAAV